MLSLDNIVVVDGVAVLKNVTNGNEIKMVHDYAVAHNVEKFVAISADSRKYGFDGKHHRVLGPEEEFDINRQYVSVEEKVDLEPILEVQAKEIVEDVLVELLESNSEMFYHEKLELQEKCDKLVCELEEVKHKLERYEQALFTLDEVIKFVRANGYELIIK